jgi:uncharacterized membrane protein YcfT
VVRANNTPMAKLPPHRALGSSPEQDRNHSRHEWIDLVKATRVVLVVQMHSVISKGKSTAATSPASGTTSPRFSSLFKCHRFCGLGPAGRRSRAS